MSNDLQDQSDQVYSIWEIRHAQFLASMTEKLDKRKVDWRKYLGNEKDEEMKELHKEVIENFKRHWIESEKYEKRQERKLSGAKKTKGKAKILCLHQS